MAVSVLHEDTSNLSRALDRAYHNGKQIESFLKELTGSVNAASVSPAVTAGSSAGHGKRSSLHVSSINASSFSEKYRAAHVVPPRLVNVHIDFDYIALALDCAQHIF